MVDSSAQPGQRRSPQREAIQRVIERAAGPLTVRQIHARAKRRITNLGIATVYRNINLLLEADRIRTVTLSDGESRYESAGLGHHHHFKCRVCRKVYDLPGCQLANSVDTRLPEGFVAEEHEVTFHGTCPDCSAK